MHVEVDWPLVVGALGDLFAFAAAFFAWRAVVAGKETTKDLSTISERVKDSTERLDAIADRVRDASTQLDDLGRQMTGVAEALTATMAEIRRMRQEERLVERLSLYERISGAVHTIMLIPTLPISQPDRVERTRSAQATMRAALAVIPGTTGGLDGALPRCIAASGGMVDGAGQLVGGADVGSAHIEIQAAIREVHEQLQRLSVAPS